MVDNINLNKISPLLSSAERVKGVDRRQRDNQQPLFKEALKGKQKKKKKKKEGEDEALSGATSSKDNPQHARLAATDRQEKEADSPAGQPKKIIDIRV
jgi:hypothetical protein